MTLLEILFSPYSFSSFILLSDMDSRRNVAKSLIDNYVENYNKKILNEKMTYYECSCRLGTGVI